MKTISPSEPRVLIIDDDEELAQALKRSLQRDGYAVRIAGDGEAAIRAALNWSPDLHILDVGLPGHNGITVARALRRHTDAPIMVLTARSSVDTRVEALNAGADDFLAKPFETPELFARLRALLRRCPARGTTEIEVGDLRLNPDQLLAYRGDRRLDLTPLQFKVLQYFMENTRVVISRERLLDEVWGYDPFSSTNTVHVFISNLRRKLEDGGEPRMLRTIRGGGYVLRGA